MRLLALFSVCVCAFAQEPVERAWQILDRGLHENNPAKRIQAVSAMGVMRPQPKSVALVESAFEDKDYSVRQAACAALGQMKSRVSIPKLRAALDDKAPEVVFAAARALFELGDPMGRQVLTAVLLGDQADASGFFASSMHDMKAKMHDTKGLVMIGVKEGAGAFLGPASAGIGVAEGLMKDSNASGKTVVAALLAEDKNPESVKAIRQGLGDKNWTVRAACARALALAGRAETFKEVAELLDDKRDEVEYSAAAAVIRMKQPAYVPQPARTITSPAKAPAKK